MKIHNPYRKRLENVSTLANEDFKLYSGIIRNSVKVFDEGVDAAIEALKPKKFADELPEEFQSILVISKSFCIHDCFLSANLKDGMHTPANQPYAVPHSIVVKNKYYYTNSCSYTHWMPFPKLD